MAKKLDPKKSNHRDRSNVNISEEGLMIMKDVRKQLLKLGRLAKNRYEGLDVRTKKKITTGIITAGAVALTALGINRMMSKKKDEKADKENDEDYDDNDDDDDDD